MWTVVAFSIWLISKTIAVWGSTSSLFVCMAKCSSWWVIDCLDAAELAAFRSSSFSSSATTGNFINVWSFLLFELFTVLSYIDMFCVAHICGGSKKLMKIQWPSLVFSQRSWIILNFLPINPRFFLDFFPRSWKVLQNPESFAKDKCQDLGTKSQRSKSFHAKKIKIPSSGQLINKNSKQSARLWTTLKLSCVGEHVVEREREVEIGNIIWF